MTRRKSIWFTTEEGKVGEVQVKDWNIDPKNSIVLGYTLLPDNSYQYVVEAYDVDNKPIGRMITKGSNLDLLNKIRKGELGNPAEGIGRINKLIDDKKSKYIGVSEVTFDTPIYLLLLS